MGILILVLAGLWAGGVSSQWQCIDGRSLEARPSMLYAECAGAAVSAAPGDSRGWAPQAFGLLRHHVAESDPYVMGAASWRARERALDVWLREVAP